MKRKIITINEELCDGCGNCVSACSEGALQIIAGKAKLVKEEFCDGFGDCIGECPTGALIIKEKVTRPFNIEATKEYLLRTKGQEALWRMEEAQKRHETEESQPMPCGCPGTFVQALNKDEITTQQITQRVQPELRNWPVQISLLPFKAPYYEKSDLLVAADCCAYAYAGFHDDFIKGHILAIGCPKLDDTNTYRDKLTAILSGNDIKSIKIAYMEVLCCMGIVKLVEDAVKECGKDISLNEVKIGIKGEKM